MTRFLSSLRLFLTSLRIKVNQELLGLAFVHVVVSSGKAVLMEEITSVSLH